MLNERKQHWPDVSTPGWLFVSLHVVINITVQLHIANDAHLIGRAEDQDQDPPPANHIHVAAGHVRVGQSGY